MTHNVGNLDRMLRIVAGLVRVCPAYLPFGISTCKTSDRK